MTADPSAEEIRIVTKAKVIVRTGGVITPDEVREWIRAAEAAARREGKIEGLRAVRDALCPCCEMGVPIDGDDPCLHRHSPGVTSLCTADEARDMLAAEEGRDDGE